MTLGSELIASEMAQRIIKTKSKTSKQPLQVVLGSQTIKAFVAAPKEFKVMGIVRMGMEFGLLATTSSGNYVRVNGSQIEALNCEVVKAAIALARTSGRGESYAMSCSSAQVVAPTLIVRKCGRLVLETSNAVAAPVQHLVPMALAA
jgi:hypothetical protein